MKTTALLPLAFVALAACDGSESKPAPASSTSSAKSAPASVATDAPSSPAAAAAPILAPTDAAPLRTQDLGEALLVDVLREGTGKVARATSAVALHYELRTEVSEEPLVSTRARLAPERFELDPKSAHRPIEGLARALTGLAQGARVRVHVPGHLAYGKSGVPELGIEPNTDLLFDVELVEVR